VRTFHRLVVLAAATGLLGTGVARAQMEHEVKAAHLFKFLSYVDWPAAAFEGTRDPFVIGVIDAEEVRASLADIVRGREARGRPVEVRRLESGDATEGVHVLFIGRPASEPLLRLVGRPALLLVTEAEGALDRGAMINLMLVDDRVRFEVAPQVAERSGLHISSRLLVLAQSVRTVAP